MRIPSNLRSGSLGFNMTPMIDVVFLLIIFFLVSSHLAKQEVQMPLPLPTAESGNQRHWKRTHRGLTINVTADGTLMLPGRHIRQTELAPRLANRLDEVGRGTAGPHSRAIARVPYRFVEPIMLACGSDRDLGRFILRLSAGGRSLMRRAIRPFTAQVSGDWTIKMTPMIDVVFLLLVFFVWTASFQIVEQVLPSHLSEESGTQPADTSDPPPVEEDFDKVVLRVLWVGDHPQWRVNQMDLGSLQQVRSRLEAVASVKRDAPVILHPDKDVPLGHVIDLYDLTRLVGFQKIQFAASEKL